ncbi:MAG: hypothetical protein A2504_17410 [Bdellovibrionales bacterium RIFOXYD12_FULL_39_22]|nr:MAG: hypothetical protein A2385_10550 [Bdellovibrionales bacterium RIFOXYB1_FULL_39_21]OFZ40783.1 MAG: hypothetical protein A2485_17180 [Bdellovibrionales bacterium RIFOXYC12_FULL_39_17]OFZ48205.1 MAG: hypothetical protein A2404_17340 [Bdellovibrionales bacterium RIFOXYC1_FULL_39_130]OFZ70634.1 MAG: hypothetical protein A2451_06895 [Bdellovibrionales bacterium RIFOXYC2_FULL_39_8]OFZ75855.1 MAG: hypothetical protein A2560_13840 [Bdellovibrionales bacterium RIFOXYD1_FULL_39_84]OFZ91916.1 MAG:
MNCPLDMLTQKNQFKFDEVCTRTDVRPYVLRFWESEFEEIAPTFINGSEKIYSLADINVILAIKELLFEKKFSINRAKVELSRSLVKQATAPADDLSLPPKEEKTVEQTSLPALENGEKLLHTKAQLEKMLALMDSIKEAHNWN